MNEDAIGDIALPPQVQRPVASKALFSWFNHQNLVVRSYIGMDFEWRHVAICAESDDADRIVTAVNAHDDLLAVALLAKVFAIEEIHRMPGKSRAPCEWDDFLDQIEAVIAKAEPTQ